MVDAGAAFPLDGRGDMAFAEALRQADDNTDATALEFGMIPPITDKGGVIGAAADTHAQLKLGGLHGSQGVEVGVGMT